MCKFFFDILASVRKLNGGRNSVEPQTVNVFRFVGTLVLQETSDTIKNLYTTLFIF